MRELVILHLDVAEDLVYRAQFLVFRGELAIFLLDLLERNFRLWPMPPDFAPVRLIRF